MNKAIFCDLQGTLGGEATANIENFKPFPFSKDALSLSKQNGYRNIVITNQSNIGRGILPRESYSKAADRILEFFNSDEPLLDEILCCPHMSSDNRKCKKPKTGLIDQSVEKYGLSIEKCYVIGDMGKNEIVMAHNAGCKGCLVLTGGGKGSLNEYRSTWADHTADLIAENALEAVKEIVK